MSRYSSLKKEEQVLVNKTTFIPGSFTCAKGTYEGSEGLLLVSIKYVSKDLVQMTIGDSKDFAVNKETSLVLSEFFKEVSKSLE